MCTFKKKTKSEYITTVNLTAANNMVVCFIIFFYTYILFSIRIFDLKEFITRPVLKSIRS